MNNMANTQKKRVTKPMSPKAGFKHGKYLGNGGKIKTKGKNK